MNTYRWRENNHVVVLMAVLIFLMLMVTAVLADTAPSANLSNEEIDHLGERMYRDGLLPSGKPMEAYIRGDVEVDSTAFSCSSCHLRAGLGSVEGGVVTPPTNGDRLFKPYRRPPSMGDVADRSGRYIYAKTVVERPAYTPESLAKALRFGVDPAGQVFNDVMPRYPLSDRDMSIMLKYLGRLSSTISPGATPNSFSFATIVTDDVSSADRTAMLGMLNRFIDGQNQQVEMYRNFIKFGYTPTIDMKYAFRQASLAVWELKGDPATWRRQLEDNYAKQPVFAILGGISNNDWQPIHNFCEDQRLPCLFPITNLPVVSSTAWYTYYFNKGYYQEGEAAARFLNRMEGVDSSGVILQIVLDSPAVRALAHGFQQTWSDLERPPVKSLILSREQIATPSTVARLVAEQKAGVLLLWGDETVIPVLASAATRLSAPTRLFVSSTTLGKAALSIDEKIRDRVFLTFPYRLTPFIGSKEGFDAIVPILTTSNNLGDRRIGSRTATMLQQATLQGLKLLYDNVYRDHLFDLMGMQMDQVVLDYERLSFGPGQRYGSKGCYIIQLGPGAEPALLPRSEWVIQ